MNSRLAALTMAAAALPLAWLAAGPLGLPMSDTGGARLLLALVLAPLIEEAVLRRGVQAGLESALARRGWPHRRATVGAAACAALAFAAIHLPQFSVAGVLQALPWLVPGAGLAALWCWRRRLSDCILMHAWFNAVLWGMSARAG